MLINTAGLCAAIGLALTVSLAVADDNSDLPQFKTLAIILESNQSDGEAEVILQFETKQGLEGLTVNGPNAPAILDMRFHDQRQLGISEVMIESAEPGQDDIRHAYPAGDYNVTAYTVDGAILHGTTTLSHELLPAPRFSPVNSELVDIDSAVITWPSVLGARGYIVEIEQDELDVNITAKLDATSVRFVPPPGFLRPGITYDVEVATISPNGNIAMTKSSFKTRH